MSANEQRIREFAYQIWESEGKPHGHAKRHWEMASKLVAAEQQPAAATATKRVSKAKLASEPGTSAVAKPRTRKPVAPVEAEIPVLPKASKSKANASKTSAAKPVAKKPKA